MDAELILRRLSPVGMSGVFVLGSLEHRITILSQQTRAINLAWALNESRSISSNSTVAVVGAGAAGLTAAAAIGRLGAHITVVEKEAVALSRFRGNTQRFLHPHAYDWPQAADSPIAGLPVMNWQAGLAHQVVLQLDRGWAVERAQSDVNLYTSTTVSEFDPGSGRLRFSGSRTDENKFDIIILAVGVGTETRIENTPAYWENDPLGQILHGGAPKQFLVSGNGDGGLVDLARACLADFDHGAVLTHFISTPPGYAFGQAVATLEAQVAAEPHRIDEIFANMDLSSLDVFLSGMLRKDRSVTFNFRARPLHRRDTMLINRVIMEWLRRHFVDIWEGEYKNSVSQKSRRTVNLTNGDEREFDVVVARHGAATDLTGVFESVRAAMRAHPQGEADVSIRPHWDASTFRKRTGAEPSTRWPGEYRVVEIDPSWSLGSRATAIENGGTVVGWAHINSYAEHAMFVWNGDGLPPACTTLPFGTTLSAQDINDNCIVAMCQSAYKSSGQHEQSWILSSERMVELRGLGSRALVWALNSKGDAAGYCDDETGQLRACAWRGGRVEILPDKGHGGAALSISDTGIVVGYVKDVGGSIITARWMGDSTEFLQEENLFAWDVNNEGTAVCFRFDQAAKAHACFAWHLSGRLERLCRGRAFAINAAGWVVGDDGDDGPFLVSPAREIRSLNALVRDPVWRFETPHGVTDDLRIVGTALRAGISRAVLLVPRF